jgi:hypothetical protein
MFDTKLDKQLSSNTNGVLVTDARGYIATSSKVTATKLDLALDGITENIQGALTSLKNGKQDKLTVADKTIVIGTDNKIKANYQEGYGIKIGTSSEGTENQIHVDTDTIASIAFVTGNYYD